MSRVSNGNLIKLKWQNIKMMSNIKERGRERESKTWLSNLIYIQQRHIKNPFQYLSKEVISLEVTIFIQFELQKC